MTREEAIKTLREDYCGNRIICELHPDQCNQEECEIWLAIKALETQPDGDVVSRSAAIDALRMDISIIPFAKAREYVREAIETICNRLEALSSAQPDLSSYSDKLWRSAYERGKAEAQAEIVRCKDCKHWREGTTYTYCDKLFGMGVLDIYDYMTTEDDFCSGAERKTDGVDC